MNGRGKLLLFVLLACVTLYFSCSQSHNEHKVTKTVVKNTTSAIADIGFQKLSEYNFFKGDMADLNPVEGVLPYDLNTPLFSDYAHKARFVKVAEGTKAVYKAVSTFDFPIGTILIKNFLYPTDFRDVSKGRKIVETRLLIHEEAGWKALPYIWNDEQTEAYLEVAGGKKEVAWIHTDGSEKRINYSVPNMNQCKGCHIKGKTLLPIGPTARQLNKTFAYKEGISNQLEKWSKIGILADMPGDISQYPSVPAWDDPQSGSLNERARAYLEINCAHCHSAEGPANTSGLFLDYANHDVSHLGIYKSPVAAGRGSGNHSYGIVPGDPEESILLYRMLSTDPGVMMPELGRKMVHEEGVALVADWIASLNPDDYTAFKPQP